MATSTTAHYDVSVRGVLGRALLGAFADLTARPCDGLTVLTGRALDQAALHGVLRRVEQLGLELVDVRRVPEGPPRRVTRSG